MKYKWCSWSTVAFSLLCLIQPVAANAEPTPDHIKRALVQIFVESVARDDMRPWQVGGPTSSTGSGVIIKGNRILTAAHVVDNAITIHVRKTGSDKRYSAVAEYIGDASDLAIVSVYDDTFFDGTSTLEIGSLPALGRSVTAWGFSKGGDQVALTKGVVSRIDFRTYAHSGFENLVCQVDAAINSGASGGAALVDGKIVGITFQRLRSDSADDVGYIVPVPVIEQFLDDIGDGEVDGVPAIAMKTQQMRNRQLREFYRMPSGTGGLLVVESRGERQDEANALRAGDVLQWIDGVPVGNDGTVPFQSGDRINADYLITRRQMGDTIPIRILRSGTEVTIDYTLKYTLRDIMLITRHYSGFIPDYEIVGGFIFQELNFDYVRNSFDENEYPDWMGESYSSYKDLWWGAREKAVIISSVLPDDVNAGYDAFEDRRVMRVNDVEVKNLDDLRRAVSENKSRFHVFEFEDPFGQIVLDRHLVEERAPIIKDQYMLSD